jgi:hypothetical protein
MFASMEKARLQEIGPRFTLKLRWLRKGLPSVLAADGVAPRSGEKEEKDDEDDEEEDDEEEVDVDMERTDKVDNAAEGEDDEEPEEKPDVKVKIPALDEEQEYEWKWKVSLSLLVIAGRWLILSIVLSAKDGGFQNDVLHVNYFTLPNRDYTLRSTCIYDSMVVHEDAKLVTKSRFHVTRLGA